jgi:hypothetical protein
LSLGSRFRILVPLNTDAVGVGAPLTPEVKAKVAFGGVEAGVLDTEALEKTVEDRLAEVDSVLLGARVVEPPSDGAAELDDEVEDSDGSLSVGAGNELSALR